MRPQMLMQWRDMNVTFHTAGPPVHALRRVNLALYEGEILGLVGESGSGKSALGATLLNLHDPDTTTTQCAAWHWQQMHVGQQDAQMWQRLRGSRMAMVFQDPMTALNPYRRIGGQLDEVLATHTRLHRAHRKEKALQALRDVGLPHSAQLWRAYPHMLSGGMRQRVVIAMALLTEPQLLVADEPTTALDVTVQAQILALLLGLCRSRGMAMVFITHDLAVLAGIADRIAVMYAGELVEVAPTDTLHGGARHPYSRALWLGMPDLHAAKDALPVPIPGVPPSLSALPQGCAFAPRCPRAQPVCTVVAPEETRAQERSAWRCHNPWPVAQAEEA